MEADTAASEDRAAQTQSPVPQAHRQRARGDTGRAFAGTAS